MILNLTPHPICIYPRDCPDRIEPGSVQPLTTIEPCPDYLPARLGEQPLGVAMRLPLGVAMRLPLDETTPSLYHLVDVELVEYGWIGRHGLSTLPRGDEYHPHRTWFVVSLVVALAAGNRTDLLVPYREVRNLEGSVIGCRQLARPTRPPVVR